MNAKAEQKERTHENILRSAASLLRERGVAGARVADVMQRAGLTVGGFYAHFPSKEALIDEALCRTATELRAQLFGELRGQDDVISGVLRRYLSKAHRDNAELGCPFPAVVSEIATTAPEHRDALASELEKMSAELAAHVHDGELPKRHIALALAALMIGGLSLARALKGTELSDEVLRACRAFGKAYASKPQRCMP